MNEAKAYQIISEMNQDTRNMFLKVLQAILSGDEAQSYREAFKCNSSQIEQMTEIFRK